MNKKMIISTAVVGTVMMAGLSGLAVANSASQTPAFTEEKAIKIALGEVQGEVLETELENEWGKLVYEVEIVEADGTVKEVEIDASTGEVLEVEIEEDDDEENDA